MAIFRTSSLTSAPRRAGLVVTIALAWLPGASSAQTHDAAASPPDRTIAAFAVLDSSTMSIEQVDPQHATTLRLFSALRNKDMMPRDMGVEFAPLLIKTPGKAATLSDAYKDRFRPSFAGTVWQFLSASVAISQDVTPVATGDSRDYLSIALRTLLSSGRPTTEFNNLMRAYDDSVKALDAAIVSQTDEERRQAAEGRAPSVAERDAPAVVDREAAVAEQQRRQKAEEQAGRALLESRRLLGELNTADKSRVGFMFEVGGAYALVVQNSTLRSAQVARQGFWATPIYRFDRRPLMLSGTMRVLHERARGVEIVDSGGRVTLRRQGVFYSFEGLARHKFVDVPLPDEDVTIGRMIGGIAYGFSRSSMLTFTFGKNFRDDFSGGGTLVASFGATIGLGSIDFGIPRND